MKDRRKPWQKAMINKEFRFSRCGSMLQSTARALKSGRSNIDGYGRSDEERYAIALGLNLSEVHKRIAEQHRRTESGFRVHSHAIAAD